MPDHEHEFLSTRKRVLVDRGEQRGWAEGLKLLCECGAFTLRPLQPDDEYVATETVDEL